MKLHLTYWIYIFGFLLELPFSASNTTVTDSSLLNLIVENSTETSFNKQLKTGDHNFNDSFSSNSVNTGPLYSHQTNEECKNNDCSRDGFSTQSTDNLSTTSKILWSLVSTVRSTNQHSSSDRLNTDEGVTVSPVNNTINMHYHDHSIVHNSNSSSSDNELDSDINLENDMHHTYSSELINNSSPGLPFVDINPTVTTSQTVTRVSENKLAKLYRFEENSTLVWESTETYPEMLASDSYLFNSLNMSEYEAIPDILEINFNNTDKELDLTSHFSNLSSTNETDFANEINNESQVTENSTTEMFYTEIDSLNYEYNESSTLLSVNNDMTTESDKFGLKDWTKTNFESHTVSYVENNTSLTTEKENETLLYHNYDISLEAEELESKDNLSIITTNLDQNTDFSHSTATSVMETLLDGNLWLMSEEVFNITNATISNTDSSIDTELPISEPDLTGNIKNDLLSKENLLVNETSDNTNNVSTMTANSSTDMSEVTDPFSYLSEETQMSTTHTGIDNHSISDVLNASSKDSKTILVDHSNEATTNSSLESTEIMYFTIPENMQKSNEIVLNAQDSSTIAPTNVNDSTENLLDTLNTAVTHDLPLLEIIKQNTTIFTSSMESKYSDEGIVSPASIEESFSTEKLNTEPNISAVHLNSMQASSTQSLTELDRSSPTQTTLVTRFSSEEIENSSTAVSLVSESSFTTYSVKENSSEDEINITTPVLDKFSHFITSDAGTDVIAGSEIPTEILSSTDESKASNQNNYTIFVSPETVGDNDSVAGNSDIPINHTGYTPLGTENENTDNIMLDKKTKIFSYPSTESSLGLFNPSSSTDTITPSGFESINPSDEVLHYSRTSSDHSEIVTESISSKKETLRENTFSVSHATDINQFTTDHILSTTVTEVNTFPTSDVSSISIGIAETHREGKHIPFSTTLVRSTTEHPRIINITAKTFSQSHGPETTENNFVNMLYTQIKAEELSPEERSNLINAVVKLPDTFYSREVLNEKIAIIHLWLLHAIADEYKNSTLNLSESKDGQMDEIEFENLPQILYILPTPEISVPNISFTFIVQNKWRNETFPVDIILTILNLHIEDLKHLVEIEDIHFTHGLLVQKHDLLSVIIEKYGIVLLSTCLITVAMIFLLICVVIYYRRKTRHSAHCLTDDKLHRNMQEAMGIDLNPAVVILQEEIREKAALNGNKICNLNDDEGWLAPIGDVPVEDNNAPFVQDTKL